MIKHENILRAQSSTETYQPEFQSRFLLPVYWPIWFGFAVLWMLGLLPWWVRAALARPIGWIAWWSSSKRRHIAKVNLSLCFPEMSEQQRTRVAKQHFYYKIRIALDLGLLSWGSQSRLRKLVRIEGEDIVKERLDRQQPIVWLTCHMLALEFGATRISLDYSGVGLVKAARNPLADWMLQRTRTRFNAILYSRDSGLKPVIKAIRNCIMFYYLPDEDLGGNESVFAPFFATQASTLATLGRLAKAGNADVIPSVTSYEPGTGKYCLRFYPALEDFPMPDREQDAVRMNQELEKLIAVQLPQYMWGMKLFKNRPEGAVDIYQNNNK